MSEPDSRVSIRGFSRDSTDLVREMEDFGWTFRPSNHGVVGRAPDSRTTISIGRNIRRSNHSFQRAWGDFRRWLKAAHPELTEVAQTFIKERDEIEEEANPVLAGILDRRTITRTMSQIGQLADSNQLIAERLKRFQTTEDPAPEAQTETEEAMPKPAPTIIDVQPLHLKKSKDGILRVQKRVWSTGRIDFACAWPDCPVTSHNPRSITQHFGATHTRPAGSYAHTPAVAPEPEQPTEAGLPWEALAETVEELRESEPAPVVNLDPPEKHPVTKQMIDAQYVEAQDMTVHVTSEAAVMLTAIQEIVSKPLQERVKILAEQVNVLTKERDEAREALAKIQQDLMALRSLVAGIGDGS